MPYKDTPGGLTAKEKQAANQRLWQAAHRDKVAAYSRAWREAHHEEANASRRDYYRTHRNEQMAYSQDYRAKNRSQTRAHDREYAKAHQDLRSTWFANHRSKARAYYRTYRRNHPERAGVHEAIRRARKRNAPVVEHISRAVVFERDQGRCHICGKKVDPKNWHLDHLIPLANKPIPGEHSYRNVAVSHPACNMRKGVAGPSQLRLS